MINRRPIPTITTVLLLLALTACALPGLGTPRPSRPAPPQATPPAAPATPLPASPTAPDATPKGQALSPTRTVTAISATPARPTAPPAAGPTAAPSQIAQATQTALPTFRPALFLLTGNQPAPAGILPQLGVFEAGGGNGSAQPATCAGGANQPRWCAALNGAALSATSDYASLACGLAETPLTASVRLPDGSSRPATISVAAPTCRSIVFSPAPGDPLGVYQVTLSQGSTRLSDSFNLAAPSAPAARLAQACLWLAGLPPGQAVRILAFGLVVPGPNDPILDPSLATWRFLGEGSFPANAGGMLWVCPDDTLLKRYPEMAYLAYPPSSEALPAGDADLLQQFQGNCANGPATRLAAGQSARVISKDLPLFSDPSLSSKALVVLHQGAVLSVVGGPVCPLQGPWTWLGKTQAAQSGWLA